MTVDLPRYVAGAAAGFDVIERAVSTAEQGVVAANGTATLRFPAVGGDRLWQITRAAIRCAVASTPEPAVRGYVVPDGAAISDSYLRTGTDRGLFDEADYPGDDGLAVREGEQLVVVWTGATPGATVTATVQYVLKGR